MTRAVYPGTFDPLTRGHEDLVRRAVRLFDCVIVAVAESRNKRPFFSMGERVAMTRDVLADVPQVRVEGFSGLLIDFVAEQGAIAVLRGLRAASAVCRQQHHRTPAGGSAAPPVGPRGPLHAPRRPRG